MSNANRLSILYIAYPLLPVTDESAGGAEQMLLTLEREMSAAGHRTTVAAADGSRVCGELLATGQPAGAPDQYEAREREHNARILALPARNIRASSTWFTTRAEAFSGSPRKARCRC